MKGSHKWADVEERSGQSDVQLLRPQERNLMKILGGFILRFANRFKILYLLQLFRYNYYDTCECAVFSYSIHDLLICYIYRNTDWGSSEDSEDYSRTQLVDPCQFQHDSQQFTPGNSSCIQCGFLCLCFLLTFLIFGLGLSLSTLQPVLDRSESSSDTEVPTDSSDTLVDSSRNAFWAALAWNKHSQIRAFVYGRSMCQILRVDTTSRPLISSSFNKSVENYPNWCKIFFTASDCTVLWLVCYPWGQETKRTRFWYDLEGES